MRVLVTGATGFLGRKICGALAKDGHHIAVLSRDVASARARIPEAGEVFAWDAVASKPPLEAIEGAGAVINLAGESVVGLWTASKKRSMRESRLKSTRNLVSAMVESSSRPKVLISASAVGYYGDGGNNEITEETGPGAGFLSNLCADWENEARRAADLGIRVVPLRIGLVLGLEGGMLPALLPAARLGLFGRLGSGGQWWPWVHVDDIVGLARFALANEIHGPLNATSPNPVRQKEFARTLGHVLGRPSLLFVPAFVLDLAGGAAGESLRSQRVLPRKSLQAGYEFHYKDLVTALSQLLGRI